MAQRIFLAKNQFMSNISSKSDTKYIGAIGSLALTSTAMVAFCQSRDLDVDLVLKLYKEIDDNMKVLVDRMLLDLQAASEKNEIDQATIADEMSEKFQSTLAKVQDSVLRNNGVSEKDVQVLLEKMKSGAWKDTESIHSYVENMGRMRWRCTGHRDAKVPNEIDLHQPIPPMSLPALVSFFEVLFPIVNSAMVEQAKRINESDASDVMKKQQFVEKYIEISGELTEQACKSHNVDPLHLQQAIQVFQDMPSFQVRTG